MDLTSLAGLILSIVAILTGMILKGANIGALASPEALLIIFVGTASAVMIAFPPSKLKNVGKLFKIIFTNKKAGMSYPEMIELFMGWAQDTRKNGLLSLESKLEEIDDEFIKRYGKMVVDGITPELIKSLAENEIEQMEDRHAKGALIFSQAGTYAPTLGVLGAVIGLISALGNMGDSAALGESIAAAFIATLMGIYSGYVLWHPFSNKLKVKSAIEIQNKVIIIECLLLIQEGVFPGIIEKKIHTFMSESERGKLSKGEKE